MDCVDSVVIHLVWIEVAIERVVEGRWDAVAVSRVLGGPPSFRITRTSETPRGSVQPSSTSRWRNSTRTSLTSRQRKKEWTERNLLATDSTAPRLHSKRRSQQLHHPALPHVHVIKFARADLGDTGPVTGMIKGSPALANDDKREGTETVGRRRRPRQPDSIAQNLGVE